MFALSDWRVHIEQRAILPLRMLDTDQTHQGALEAPLGLNRIPKVYIIVPCLLVLVQCARLVRDIDHLQWIVKVRTTRVLAKGNM